VTPPPRESWPKRGDARGDDSQQRAGEQS